MLESITEERAQLRAENEQLRKALVNVREKIADARPGPDIEQPLFVALGIIEAALEQSDE
jgi:regulator of replication initiation timing